MTRPSKVCDADDGRDLKGKMERTCAAKWVRPTSPAAHYTPNDVDLPPSHDWFDFGSSFAGDLRKITSRGSCSLQFNENIISSYESRCI